jgi:hypothetical protein
MLHISHSHHKHKQSPWQSTSTHKNGSHSCPRSPEAPSPNAGKHQSTQHQITTTTKRKRTHEPRHRPQWGRYKRRGASGGGWNRGRERIRRIWPTKVQGA